MSSFKGPLAVPLVSLIVLSVGCSHPSTALMVRIADVGGCTDQRDIILEVLPHGGLKLNSENQKREELGPRLDDIFKNRVLRYAFIKGDPTVSFGEFAEVIDIAARHVDYVAVVTPSVVKRATYQGGSCLPHDRSKDTCLDPRLPAAYITRMER
jgi:biopolymer transport protein ExbD